MTTKSGDLLVSMGNQKYHNDVMIHSKILKSGSILGQSMRTDILCMEYPYMTNIIIFNLDI